MTCKNDVVSLLLLLLFLIPYAAAQTDDTAPPPPYDFKLGPVFDSTLAVVILVFVVLFFSLAFFSVYFRRRMQGGTTNTDNGRSLRAGRGISDEVIRTFPTFQYSAVRGLKIGKGQLECAVCLNEFEDDETLRLLPKCNHVFHADCVDAWLSSHNTCPVCRANLLPSPGETTTVQIFDPESGYGESSCRQDPEAITRSPEVNVASTSAWTNQNRPPRTRSTGLRLGGLFPRSHSTGHSLVQNYERFTLKLPEDIRSQIMNSSVNLNRARSLVVLPRVRSEKRGYRSGSTGRSSSQYERFDGETRPDRWGFRMVTPFISRTGSVRSSGAGEEAVDGKSLLQSFRNPVNQ